MCSQCYSGSLFFPLHSLFRLLYNKIQMQERKRERKKAGRPRRNFSMHSKRLIFCRWWHQLQRVGWNIMISSHEMCHRRFKRSGWIGMKNGKLSHTGWEIAIRIYTNKYVMPSIFWSQNKAREKKNTKENEPKKETTDQAARKTFSSI